MRAIVGANFILAVVLVLGRVGYFLLRGSPMPGQYVGGHVIPGWVNQLIFQSLLLYLFLSRHKTFSRYSNEVFLRGLTGLSGSFALLFELALPALQADIYGTAVYTPERPFWWYLCGTYLLYALVGTVRSASPPTHSLLARRTPSDTVPMGEHRKNQPFHTRDAVASSASPRPPLVTELLLLPDGRILVHNLTPAFAAILSDMNPADEQIAPRTGSLAASGNVSHATGAARSEA